MRLHLVGEYVPIFPTGFLGFRIRRLHKFYSLSGIYFCVSLVTNILFELCNETRTALNTQARQKRWRLPCRKRAVNLRKMWHLLTFTGVHRSENPRFSNCFAVGEFEYSFHFPVFSHYGESQKTPVFWNLPVC